MGFNSGFKGLTHVQRL